MHIIVICTCIALVFIVIIKKAMHQETTNPSNNDVALNGGKKAMSSHERQIDRYRSVLENDQWERLRDLVLGLPADPLSQVEVEKLELKLEVRRQEDQKLYKTMELNNQGIALEKAGKVEEAIQIYEQCIEIKYTASHA